MIDAQTKSELPKNGASTRLAAISTPSSTPPERKTVPRTGSVAAAARGRSARGGSPASGRTSARAGSLTTT